MAAHDRGDLATAVRLYEKAAVSDPAWSTPWYNLGLLNKERRDWKASLRCNQEAVLRNPSSEAAWWNLGIAATALSDWNEARRAWTAYGIELPGGDGEIRGDFGYTPIRINPEEDGEVIWAQRIDPARCIVRSVPFPKSGHRHGDLLLHDGAPNGYRLLREREVSVFDELQILSRSPLGTFEAIVRVGSVDDLISLEKIAMSLDCAAEDWSSITYICKQCSAGRPHEGHGHPESHAAEERRVGIAAPSTDEAWRLLRAWEGEGADCAAVDLAELLAPR
jgi:hypothetical protein